MTIRSQYETRTSETYRRQMTNPDEPGNTAQTDARIDAAGDDVEGDFLKVVGVPYDETRKEHVSVAVSGVDAYLAKRGGKSREEASEWMSDYRRELRQLHGRILPVTSSRMSPTEEKEGSVPAFDDASLADFVPEADNEKRLPLDAFGAS